MQFVAQRIRKNERKSLHSTGRRMGAGGFPLCPVMAIDVVFTDAVGAVMKVRLLPKFCARS